MGEKHPQHNMGKYEYQFPIYIFPHCVENLAPKIYEETHHMDMYEPCISHMLKYTIAEDGNRIGKSTIGMGKV